MIFCTVFCHSDARKAKTHAKINHVAEFTERSILMIHVNNIIYYFSHILHNSHIIACEPALDAEETVLKLKDCDHTNPAVNKFDYCPPRSPKIHYQACRMRVYVQNWA